ncbi:hypothetical protein QCA50_009003 [Cerrena zonata]|uniref:Chromo domain-containing protein n=1 Tax=Cerrena zonata TaxID=2478898 RepID=A0AAW0G8U3_9APHY
MAKKPTQADDSDVEMDEPSKNNKKQVASNEESDDVEGGSEGEAEEEYEIENILGHKYNMKEFEGRIGYLVKWKGFPDSENSYVDERDAVGAQDLIAAYWKTLKKDPKKGRKSNASAREPSAQPVEGSPPPQQKKRGRPRKSKTPDIEISDDEEEEVAPKKKAKPAPRKSAGSASKGRKPAKLVSEDEDAVDDDLGTMDKWMDAPSWEHIVEAIDTVERTRQNELYVYFTLNNKSATKAGFTRCREKSQICRKKMPEKLLDFYEKNLRWREDDS